MQSYFGLFGASHENAKIKHAKIKQTPKIKIQKSTIVYGDESIYKYK